MSPLDWKQVTERLTLRDLAILDDLEQFRLMTSRQLQRLHLPVGEGQHATVSAATRSTLRVLGKLEAFGVISRLSRRIGGVRSGSQGIVWQLTSTGSRVQQERWGHHGRRRYAEPSTLFVAHTLTVAELGVRLKELERAGRLEVVQLQTEPDNWRTFTGKHTQLATLKPDLSAITAAGDFEDHWFIEADRATEHLPKILAKCGLYAAYAKTGLEQSVRGVFPRVLWLVPDQPRARAIQGTIDGDKTLPVGLFLVRTDEQFEAAVAPDEGLDHGLP